MHRFLTALGMTAFFFVSCGRGGWRDGCSDFEAAFFGTGLRFEASQLAPLLLQLFDR
jgi:hypothetical protein